MRQGRVGVTRGNGLALLREAKPAAYRPGRLSANRAPGWTAAAGDGASPAVKHRQRDPVVVAHARDRFLRAVQRPVRGNVAAVLVAVGVADHDHLRSAGRPVPPVAVHGEIRRDPWRGIEIVERLESGTIRRPRDTDQTSQRGPSAFPAPRVIESEWAERLRAIDGPDTGQQAEEPPRLGALFIQARRREIRKLRWGLGE